jgi:aspartate-semialdehyde dehydrogenase
VLEPLRRKYGIEAIMCASLQAISGAGYPGVASMDIVDNVVPHISGEEEKMEWESRKILGDVNDDGTEQLAQFGITAHCNRVGVTDGHTITASIKFTEKPASVEEVVQYLSEWVPDVYAEKDKMHSLPDRALRIREEPARPQPRFDRMAGGGYTTSVGRIRECSLLDMKLTLVTHNTILGAAGGSILNAEYCHAIGLLQKQAPSKTKTYR